MTPDARARLDRLEAHYAGTPFVREICVTTAAPPPGAPATVRLDNAGPSGLHALVVADEAYLRSRHIVGVSEWVRFELETLAAALDPGDRPEHCRIELAPLPRGADGHVDREAVAKRMGAAGAAAGIPADEEPEALARRVQAIASRLSGRPATRGSHLDLDLGLDSIARVELLLALERELGLAPDEAAATACATVEELTAVLRAARPASAEAGDDPWLAVLQRADDVEAAEPPIARRALWLSVATYGLLLAIRLVARAMAGLRAHGVAHLPRRGAFLLCPNHQTLLDGFLVAAVLPFGVWRRAFFVGASEYYATRASAWFARTVGIVPIDADANLPRAMRRAARGLRRDGVLVLFPEGERSIDGALKPFRLGGPVLATRLRLPVVPVAITGAFAWWPRGRAFAWRRAWRRGVAGVHVRIGPPLVAGVDGVPRDARAFAARLRDRVASLALPGPDAGA